MCVWGGGGGVRVGGKGGGGGVRNQEHRAHKDERIHSCILFLEPCRILSGTVAVNTIKICRLN